MEEMSLLMIGLYNFIYCIFSCLDDQDDPNIDDDMMKEYEDFVNDFEEHLMLQEFGQEF
jgi:hypothetical protein